MKKELTADQFYLDYFGVKPFAGKTTINSSVIKFAEDFAYKKIQEKHKINPDNNLYIIKAYLNNTMEISNIVIAKNIYDGIEKFRKHISGKLTELEAQIIDIELKLIQQDTYIIE